MEMNFCDTIKGDIKEYCIACLNQSQNMFNLKENEKKMEMFLNLFHIELSNYKQYPHFLCCACDVELNMTNNFCQTVRRTLLTLEEYNRKIKFEDSDDEDIKEESYDDGDTIMSSIKTEDSVKNEPKEESDGRILHKDSSKMKIVSLETVDQVIEEFKSKLSENITCIICGFIAANRRSISSHMAIFHKDVKNNWCLECNSVFEDYEKHKENHTSRHRCPFCGKEITVPHFIEHLKSHSGSFECKECNKTFKSAGWLTKHSRIHTNEKPYVCPNCNKGFIQLSSLRYHLNTHGDFSCDSCKKRYKTEKELGDHKCEPNLEVTSPKEIWVNQSKGNENETQPLETIIIKGVEKFSLQNFCTVCNKRVKSLKQHVNKYHILKKEEEEQVSKQINSCELCQKCFSTAYKLKSHMRAHTGHLPYKCKYCDKRTLTRSRLKDHERTHTKEKPYICNICGKGLSQASVLRTHMRQHTGRPEICNLCGKSFCRKSQLKLHLSKHMGERPFLCTECGRTFAQRSHLSEHMVSHSEERPFGCSLCDKRFKTNNLLKEHLKLHQGYKPFRCPTCPYACYKAYRLQQHMKQHSKETCEQAGLSEPVLQNPVQCIKTELESDPTALTTVHVDNNIV